MECITCWWIQGRETVRLSTDRMYVLPLMAYIRFLAFVDLLGTTYTAATLATGYGAHIAQPLLRTAVEGRVDQVTEDEALRILEQCMRVLFYRDARSINKVSLCLSFSSHREVDPCL